MVKEALRASSTAPCTFVAESWVRSKFLTSAMPCTYSSTLETSRSSALNFRWERACSARCMAALTAKNSTSPVSVISPIRQSKRNIIAAMMPEVTSPRLLSLNQPIGRYRRCSAISIRLLAQARLDSTIAFPAMGNSGGITVNISASCGKPLLGSPIWNCRHLLRTNLLLF